MGRLRATTSGIIRGALALCLALSAGLAPAAEPPRKVRLQLKWLHQFQFAGYYAAQARGFYADEGLEVEILEGHPRRAPVEVLLSGQADFAIHTGADLLHARLEGAPLVALAAFFQHSPSVVVARREAGILRPADLVGRTLMLTQEHGEANVLAMFRREGIEVGGDPVRSVQTRPHTWNHRDLAEGRVDALSGYLTTEPAALRRAGVDVTVLRPIEYGIDFYGDTLFTTEALLSASPDLAERFLRASVRGWAWAMAHPGETADVIRQLPSARSHVPGRQALLDEAQAMRDLVLPDLVELGHMNPGRWERMADELHHLGVVKGTARLAGLMPAPRPRPGLRLGPALAAAGGLLLLVAVALLWAWQLRREVRLRTADLSREVALRARQARELEASLGTNRAILAAIPDLIFVNRRDGIYLDLRARTPQDLAAEPAALLGRKPRDILPGDLAERLQEMIVRAIDEEPVQPLEYPLVIHGQRQFFEARVVRQDADTALTIVRNVSAEREARERLSLLGAAIEQAVEDVVITDAAGTIRYVNPAFERSTGYSAAEALGKNPRLLRSGLHDAGFYREIWETLGAGRPWQGRFHNRTKDKRVIVQDATIVAIRDGRGALTGYVSTRQDVTARVELESQLAQAQRLEAIGTLAGGIAHDFNNILSAIVGSAELALGEAGDGPVAEELRSILMAAERAAQLTRQVLAFGRQGIEAARPVELAALVAESLRFLRATLPSTIDLRSHLRSRALVRADPGDLQRVVLNLCTNSALAMRGSAGVLELRLDDVELDAKACARTPGTSPGPYLRLAVVDTGSGIAPEIQARIFEPFFTTRAPGEGTGLGLSIVHGIVSRLGGAIAVDSQPGQGTTFEVYLPVDRSARPEAPAPPAAEVRRGAGRVLVVDDEPMLARILDRSLTRQGFTVRAFTSSAEALRALERDPDAVDALVTDLAMPHLAGDELARRALALRRDLPVVLCTGNRQDLSEERARELGIARVLEKPVDSARLTEALRQVVRAG